MKGIFTAISYTYLGSKVYSHSESDHTLVSTLFVQGHIEYSTGIYTPFYNTADHVLGINGKQEELGSLTTLDYGARMYDPAIGRWGVVDPLADDFPSWTPYNYCHNNPIVLIDPDGRSADWYQSESRALLWKDENKQQITVNGEQFKNVGTSASIGTGDGNYINYYQNVPVSISNAPVNAQETVLNNDGLKGQLLSRNSPLSEKSQIGLMTASIHKGQQDFIHHSVTKATVNTLLFVATGGIEGVTALGGAAVRSIGNIKVPIYRVFGGEARAIGNYWSSINPKLYGSQYRNLAGLPNSNTGAFTLKATTPLRNINPSTIKPAAPLDGNFGRLVPELKVFDKGSVVVKDFWVNF
ncbi:MAG: RHS repeat-associated core domain-containing protein [Bacteroidales bacterium]|nr:RHS repeat-associated core domain-containing protein [Bacteroidales bacterium]